MNRLFITNAAIASALAAMLVACSTDSTVPDIGRTPKTLTVKQEDAAGNHSTQKRSIITDQGEKGLNAIWKEGDVMSVYNLNSATLLIVSGHCGQNRPECDFSCSNRLFAIS